LITAGNVLFTPRFYMILLEPSVSNSSTEASFRSKHEGMFENMTYLSSLDLEDKH